MARTPIHPGEHLAEELKELSIFAAELARQIDVPVNQVTGIINGQRAITADTHTVANFFARERLPRLTERKRIKARRAA